MQLCIRDVQFNYASCMPSTSVRIDTSTHRDLKQLAEAMAMTVGETVSLAVRRLRQDQMGAELRADLDDVESRWLDADLA